MNFSVNFKTVLFWVAGILLSSNVWALNAPSSLSAVASSATLINLSWQDNATNESGYIIQRSLNSSSGFSEIARTSVNSVAFSNTNLAAGTYYYRVRGFRNRSGSIAYSSYSNIASATAGTVVVDPAPVAPSISSFTANSSTISAGQSITLSWSASNATSLQINPGSLNVTGTSSVVVTPSVSTTYTLTASSISGSVLKLLSIVVNVVTQPPSAGVSVPAGMKGFVQLQGAINTNAAAKVYDIDMYDNSAALFASLKQSGHIVICYFSAGSYENWRTDASQFPAVALGNNLSGWPGERWLDTRNLTVRSIMTQRMDMAKSKGCDGIDPDNVDGYANNSGFPLTAQDQIDYNSFLADQAHARGMIIALKNSTDLVSSLVNKFDFAVVEECFKYNECSAYSPFISQNKAVLNIEYTSYSSSICTQAASLNFSTAFYNLNLDGTVFNPCP